MTTAAPTLDLSALYKEHGRLVLRRIRRFYRAEQAPDVLHEVFARAIEKADTYRGEASPIAWLYGLTTRHCLARLRDERRRRELLEEVGEVPWTCPITEPTTEARVFLAELWRRVDPELAQIGVYYYLDGMSQADIGELLGVTGRTVSNRLQQLSDLARDAAGGSP
ncbi:MAG: sigma-70 family RNA polymerase sigma factor [Alphaproteobacteria bacterium]|nr:sigma-70 family RNA polymerase sigma factor [Alphaproteobacteria bacterium]